MKTVAGQAEPNGTRQPKAFADQLREHRKRVGITQEGLARLAKTTLNTVARLERGKMGPSWDLACRLADALGVGPEVFYGSVIAELYRKIVHKKALAESYEQDAKKLGRSTTDRIAAKWANRMAAAWKEEAEELEHELKEMLGI
jgi:putative transcriptional regulator